jgi:hypothetical protein
MCNNEINPSNNYKFKIDNFIFENEKHKKDLCILEFGVREGRSTKMFLDICDKNDGNLISVDIDDYSNLFENQNWTFIKSRDDDYEKVSSNFHSKKFDIILIDSLHEPLHVSKLVNMYWKHLRKNGSMYIDDISWLPYVKNSWRDHEYTENINRDTFYKILEIQLNNFENINLTFTFNGSGMCRMIKLNDNELNKPKIIVKRNFFLKKFIKKIINIFKKK